MAGNQDYLQEQLEGVQYTKTDIEQLKNQLKNIQVAINNLRPC